MLIFERFTLFLLPAKCNNIYCFCKDTVYIDEVYDVINIIHLPYDKNQFKIGKFAKV